MTAGPSLAVVEWGAFWMIRLRWIAVAGIVAAPGIARLAGVSLPSGTFLVLGALVASYNGFLYRWSRAGGAVPELAIHVQMVADLLALTGVFHFSGGVENPLLAMYAIHVVIAAIVLSRLASFMYAGLAAALAAGLALGEGSRVLGHVTLAGASAPDLYRARAFVSIRVAGLAAVLFMVAYLASVIGERLRRRENELLELSHHLAEQDRRKSQYVVMLAHSILLRLDDIQHGMSSVSRELSGDISEAARGMLGRVRQWLEGLHAFIQDGLDLSRIRAAGELVMSYVYLPRLVYQEIQELGGLARERGISFAVESPPHVPPVRGNAQALSQALQNLFRNAIAYSPPGATVRVTLVDRGAAVELAVRDQGIGISSEELPHIFEEFYRSQRARQMERSGTGLGLAIVKFVMELHGGQVEVESEEAKGSCFTLRLPALGAEESFSTVAKTPSSEAEVVRGI